MVELLGNVLEFSLKRDLCILTCHLLKSGYFFIIYNKETKSFVAEDKSGLHNRELLKYHGSFPILVFEGSLSIEIAL